MVLSAMLRLIRRHLKTCSHTSSKYRRCACPIHVYGTLGGETVRRALDLNSWEAASDLVRSWEASGQIGVVKADVPTVATARQSRENHLLQNPTSSCISRCHWLDVLGGEDLLRWRSVAVTADKPGSLKE